VPFFSSYGLFLLFLNKSKWGKKYAAYFIKNKIGYLRINHKKLGDEKINMMAIYLIKAYNFIFFALLFLSLFFVLGCGIFIFFWLFLNS
jgi:hypothetical protein